MAGTNNSGDSSAGQPAMPAPTVGTSGRAEALVIRSWPKIVLMLPTLFMAIGCGIAVALMGMPKPEEAADFGFRHYPNLLFLLVLAINLTVLLYDLNLRGFIIVTLLIVTLVLGLALLNRGGEGGLWQKLAEALSIRAVANAAFYFAFALILLFNLFIAWVITRFNYWKVEHNEIIIHRGFMQEQERHPTAQARFKLVIDDVVERAILGSGKLVFCFGDDHTEHELPTVLFVHRKAKKLDELLGKIDVV